MFHLHFQPLPKQKTELSAAFFDRIESKSATKSLTFDLFTPEVDAAYTSPDGKTAVIWLALRDDSGRLLATEPGLVLGILTDNGWQVLLPGDPGWDEIFNNLPEGLLPAEQSPAPKGSEMIPNVEIQTLNGYYLPYAADTSRWLEGSISHFQSIPELGYPSCTNSFVVMPLTLQIRIIFPFWLPKVEQCLLLGIAALMETEPARIILFYTIRAITLIKFTCILRTVQSRINSKVGNQLLFVDSTWAIRMIPATAHPNMSISWS